MNGMNNVLGFDCFDLSSDVLNEIRNLGFNEPLPIQAEAIPRIMKGADLIGQSKTGSGKTLAFAIPIVEGIDPSVPAVQALVLTPTRELAVQVCGEFRSISGRVKSLAVYGGQAMGNQVKPLSESRVHVVVGTPGRVIDHIKRRTLDLRKVKFLVLDEADRMLDMGFINDVRFILHSLPESRQTMLFSATMPREIRDLAAHYMKTPEFISISGDELVVEEIEQVYYEVKDQSNKLDAFFRILEIEKPESAIVFCNTKRWAESLCGLMRRRRLHAERLHGDLSQTQRDYVMESFRRKKIRFLVATDVAARGLDVEGITHIFNYDLPQEPQNYVHRIGRTGRVGRTGKAVSIIVSRQIRDLWNIEHVCRTSVRKAESL